jgi:hypothetical protein
VIKAAKTGPAAGGLAGPNRAILYTLALGTGFRADELATLTPDRFALDTDPPTVTVMACYAKNRTEAVQPIAAGLADQLRPWGRNWCRGGIGVSSVSRDELVRPCWKNELPPILRAATMAAPNRHSSRQ